MKSDLFLKCPRCDETKHCSLFYRDKKNKSGFRSECNACGKIDREKRELSAGNRERINAARRLKKAEEIERRKSLPLEERQAIVAAQREKRQLALQRKIANGFDYAASRAAARITNNAYRAANRETIAARKSIRERNVTEATPPWVKRKAMERDFKTMALLFRIYTGQTYQVDHVVPLRGKIGQELIVCGLHCDANLTIVPELENRHKSNQIWPDMP